MHDLIIIGSGPAGLSAAVYGRRAGFSTLVIEKNPMSGGQVLNTYEVDNYLGLPGINGFDMGMKFREHAEKMQAEFIEADVLGVEDMGDYKLVKTTDGDYEAKAVIIASGASHSHLGVPGEEELSGMGVSYCATCDGAFFRGKDGCRDWRRGCCGRRCHFPGKSLRKGVSDPSPGQPAGGAVPSGYHACPS